MLLKRITAVVLSVTLLAQLVGCGTILHPERKGQRDGNLDPSIVILDAVGLFFFIIPGVIAFAMDFNNGTIYLPGGKRADVSGSEDAARMVYLGDKINDPAVVAKVLSDVSGQVIDAKQIKHQQNELTTVALLN
jgi:hypothetical protein